MASLTEEKIRNVYKDFLHTDNNNSGISTSIKQITCGDGDVTALSLSNQDVRVDPASDSTTSFAVRDSGGNALFCVDTTNDLVKASLGQHIVNTQYKNFGLTQSMSSGATAGQHVLLHSDGTVDDALAISALHMGTGTDPATSLTLSNNAMSYLKFFWYIHDNISIDAIHSLEAADAASGDTTRFHLFEYDYADGSASVLTNGTLVAHSADQVNAGYEQMYYNTWTIDSANISSGKVILCTMESDTVNSDYVARVTVKYHLR